MSIYFYACVKQKDGRQEGNGNKLERKDLSMKEVNGYFDMEFYRGDDCFEAVVYYTAERHWRDEGTEITINCAERDGVEFELTDAEHAAALEIAKGQVDDDFADNFDQEADHRYDQAREREDF
jgi:hypothetical protein